MTADGEKKLWNRFGDIFDCPSCLTCPEKCFYARDYVSHGGYKASEANQLISNFKIETRHKGGPRWRHKRNAANQFSIELAQLLPKGIAVTVIPSSKTTTDPEYDPRFDFLFEMLNAKRGDLTFHSPIVRAFSVEPVHLSKDHRPSSEKIVESLKYVGFGGEAPMRIAIVDDLITTGKHFEACRKFMRDDNPEIDVYGVFWGRVVWPEKIQEPSD
jgi:hypothetical protein